MTATVICGICEGAKTIDGAACQACRGTGEVEVEIGAERCPHCNVFHAATVGCDGRPLTPDLRLAPDPANDP